MDFTNIFTHNPMKYTDFGDFSHDWQKGVKLFTKMLNAINFQFSYTCNPGVI